MRGSVFQTLRSDITRCRAPTAALSNPMLSIREGEEPVHSHELQDALNLTRHRGELETDVVSCCGTASIVQHCDS
jgi:hypothetical protein